MSLGDTNVPARNVAKLRGSLFLNMGKPKIVEVILKKLGVKLGRYERVCIFTIKLPKLKSIV